MSQSPPLNDHKFAYMDAQAGHAELSKFQKCDSLTNRELFKRSQDLSDEDMWEQTRSIELGPCSLSGRQFNQIIGFESALCRGEDSL